MTSAVIVDIVRTASGKGKPGGALSEVHPVVLLSTVLQQLTERNGLDPVLVDDVIAGCVVQVKDQALNIGRSALLHAGFPISVPATTVDRQCGSSQQAAHFAAQGVIAGAYDIAIACGVESMSRVPMGSNVGDGDPMGPLAERFPDGLPHQGIGAELIAARNGFTREDLDAFSARSHQRAAAYGADGSFDREIVPVTLPDGSTHLVDETVRASTTAEGLAGLIPATHLALKRSGLTIDQIDAYEVNEAFAPVPLAWAKEFDADQDRLNPRGGAIALGHPLGASGMRIMATMLNHLEATGGRYGLQTMCEGGGMANATIIERL